MDVWVVCWLLVAVGIFYSDFFTVCGDYFGFWQLFGAICSSHCWFTWLSKCGYWSICWYRMLAQTDYAEDYGLFEYRVVRRKLLTNMIQTLKWNPVFWISVLFTVSFINNTRHLQNIIDECRYFLFSHLQYTCTGNISLEFCIHWYVCCLVDSVFIFAVCTLLHSIYPSIIHN